MSPNNACSATRATPHQPVRSARQIILREVEALSELAARLDESFAQAVDLVRDCQGSVIVTGMGKAGLIGQKIAATLASTGTPSHYVHPAEAVHGDLGRIRTTDVVLVLSFSGENGRSGFACCPVFHAVGCIDHLPSPGVRKASWLAVQT